MDTRKERIAKIAAHVEDLIDTVIEAVNDEWQTENVNQWASIRKQTAKERLIGFVEGVAHYTLPLDGWSASGEGGHG